MNRTLSAEDGNCGKSSDLLNLTRVQGLATPDALLKPTMYEMAARAETSVAVAGSVQETDVDSIVRVPAVQTFELAGKGEKEEKKEMGKRTKAKKPKKEKKRKSDKRGEAQRRGSSAVLVLNGGVEGSFEI